MITLTDVDLNANSGGHRFLTLFLGLAFDEDSDGGEPQQQSK
jgi:hypothetical protein